MWQRKMMQGTRNQKIGAAAAAIALASLVPFTPLAPIAPAYAQDAVGFRAFGQELGNLALARGISQATVNAVIPTLEFLPQAIALDRAQPGGRPGGPIPKFAPYRARHVDANRIRDGRAKYLELRSLLTQVERQTGVPESIMIAIWGHETNYGRIKGNYDLANALATLAYEGRRRQLFTEEFIAVLKLMDSGFPRWKLKGSWAGATGHPQFLPSMYLRLARDGDGDRRADIWDSEADALASIANYFVNSGWRPGQVWGVAVSVPETLDRAAIASRTVAPRCPKVHERHSRWKSVAEWRALGVIPMRAGIADRDMATFFQPDGPNTPAWLLTGNYRVILEYNCSNFYALSVGLLSDAVRF
jgi:membrane-bound lytic murein transglycosylase B